MAVLRIQKKQNFVIVEKTCLSTVTLTWAAKGLHCYLMGLPDDCRIQVAKLVRRSANGRDSVRRLLAELEEAGFIQRTVCRDETTGRFGGIEYLVLEIPEPKNHDKLSAPESPSSVTPIPETPVPGNPTPEIAARNINIKYNNKITNQELITAAKRDEEDKPCHRETKVAAVFSTPNQQNSNSELKHWPHSLPLESQLQADLLIGQELTPNQLAKIQALVSRLDGADSKSLVEEIQYTLLSPKCFTACGNDFSRKLNAIRTVILRGDWQTPAPMVNDRRLKTQLPMQALENDLRDAKAEMFHFERLLDHAKEEAKRGLEELVSNARLKIQTIKNAIAQENAALVNVC